MAKATHVKAAEPKKPAQKPASSKQPNGDENVPSGIKPGVWRNLPQSEKDAYMQRQQNAPPAELSEGESEEPTKPAA